MTSAGAGACRPLAGMTLTLSDCASLRGVYRHLFCLMTLIMTIFAAISVMRSVVELACPDRGSTAFASA